MLSYSKTFQTFRSDFRPVVSIMTGTPIGRMPALTASGICVACGGKHSGELKDGRVELCQEDRVCFRLVTNRYAGLIKNIVERLQAGKLNLDRVIDPTQINSAPKPWLIPIGIEKFACETTGKTPAQCETETKHGRCPTCERPHKARANGRILLCPECKNLYIRINKWAVALIRHISGELVAGRFSFSDEPKLDVRANLERLSRIPTQNHVRKPKALKDTHIGNKTEMELSLEAETQAPVKPIEKIDPVLEAMSVEQLADEASALAH